MRAADIANQLRSYYGNEHKNQKWYKSILTYLFEICMVNGYLIYKKVNSLITNKMELI